MINRYYLFTVYQRAQLNYDIPLFWILAILRQQRIYSKQCESVDTYMYIYSEGHTPSTDILLRNTLS